MTMRVVTLGLVATGLTLVARAAAAQGEFHWKGKVAAGKTIEIKGVNGDVSAQAIQLRTRTVGQNLTNHAQIYVRDAAGENPILILDLTTDVANGGGSK